MNQNLPLGKIPPTLLKQVLSEHSPPDPRMILGPGIGLDCAVIDMGDRYLVLKSDPITFATDEIGWYTVQVNANDIATTGASPKWFLATLLLPEGQTSAEDILRINRQLQKACQALDISLVGGHTEITYGLERPIIAGTMIGEVAVDGLVTPQGASPGDSIMVTKSVPIEATAILARERPAALAGALSPEERREAQAYIHKPGISVVQDAKLALEAGAVSAMHDPTEGGLASALWELAEACGHRLVIDALQIPITPLSTRICQVFNIEPLGAIASGSLLLSAPPEEANKIRQALVRNGIPCTEIGQIESGPSQVLTKRENDWIELARPARDEITRVFET